MRTALDAPADKLDDAEQKFVDAIREHGWFATHVFGEGDLPGFSYSTGFWVTCNAPEVIVFSLKRETAHAVLWDLFNLLKAGGTLPLGSSTSEVFGNLNAYIFEVDKSAYAEHLGWSRWFYGGDTFPCEQVVWPDRGGVFPWQDGFDQSFKADQPDLTENGWQNSLRH